MNPLLSILGKCQTIGDKLVPVWAQLQPWTAVQARHTGADVPSGTQDAAQARLGETGPAGAAQDGAGAGTQRSKRRRLTSKAGASGGTTQARYSYAASWEAYIDGNIVSESSRRFIANLLVATAAIKSEDSDDSSEDSDAEVWRSMDVRWRKIDFV